MDSIFEIISEILIDILSIPLERWNKLEVRYRIIISIIIILILSVLIYLSFTK